MSDQPKFGTTYRNFAVDGYFRASCACCGGTVLLGRLAGDRLPDDVVAYCSPECWDKMLDPRGLAAMELPPDTEWHE